MANNLVFEFIIKLVEVPPKETDVVLNKLVPLIVMVSPGKPNVGVNEVIVGACAFAPIGVKVTLMLRLLVTLLKV
jgi:hypothetical protein